MDVNLLLRVSRVQVWVCDFVFRASRFRRTRFPRPCYSRGVYPFLSWHINLPGVTRTTSGLCPTWYVLLRVHDNKWHKIESTFLNPLFTLANPRQGRACYTVHRKLRGPFLSLSPESQVTQQLLNSIPHRTGNADVHHSQPRLHSRHVAPPP